MKVPKSCKACGGTDLFWFTANENKSGVTEGRLRTHEITCVFVLGCQTCSETLKTVSADRLVEEMNGAFE
jgi:hypothetical protein